MPSWSRLKDWLGRKGPTPEGADAEDMLARVRWVPANENAFGVDILDCWDFAQSMLAVTSDRKIADSYLALRHSSGEEYRGCAPEDSLLFECDLRYPHHGEFTDGPIFKAEAMEDKWDIYLYDGYLYFARSWTGSLDYRAKIVFDDESANVVAVEARKVVIEGGALYPVAVVDFLIRSHLYRLPIPHPLPNSVGNDPRTLALVSFSYYGRYGRLGTFADTTGLQTPRA